MAFSDTIAALRYCRAPQKPTRLFLLWRYYKNPDNVSRNIPGRGHG